MDTAELRTRTLNRGRLWEAVIARGAELGVERSGLADAAEVSERQLLALQENTLSDTDAVMTLASFVGEPLDAFIDGPAIDYEAERRETDRLASRLLSDLPLFWARTC
jgi:hypothetical protein